MLVLHGAGGTATGMRDHTSLDVEADRLGYVVAYLEGSGVYRAWRSNESADLRFVTDLIEELKRKTPIDEDRVFVVGYSDGGRFAQRLACNLGHHIAAFVSVSAATDTTLAGACPAASDVSVLFVLGTDDPSIGWDAARVPGPAASLTAEQTMAHWATLNGCLLAPVASQAGVASGSGSAVERWEYPGCRGGAVILYVMHGEGHGWPGVVDAPSGTNTVTASGLIAEFLESTNRD